MIQTKVQIVSSVQLHCIDACLWRLRCRSACVGLQSGVSSFYFFNIKYDFLFFLSFLLFSFHVTCNIGDHMPILISCSSVWEWIRMTRKKVMSCAPGDASGLACRVTHSFASQRVVHSLEVGGSFSPFHDCNFFTCFFKKFYLSLTMDSEFRLST